MLNNFVQATAVFALLLIQSQVPAAPDDNRSAMIARALIDKSSHAA
jgi:hypothetical protein